MDKAEVTSSENLFSSKVITFRQITNDKEIPGLKRGEDCVYHLNGNVVNIPFPDITKKDGIRESIKHYNGDAPDCVHIGDSENDITVMENCGLLLGVRNDIDGVNVKAKMILDKSFDEGDFEITVNLLYGESENHYS